MWNAPWILNGMDENETTSIVLAFIGFEVGVRKMNPKSTKRVYLSAINNYFIMNKIQNFFSQAVKSSIVNISLKGYIRIFHMMNPESGAKKFAFTIELVKYLEQAVMKYKPKWIFATIGKPLSLAMEFGIYFLLRKSEFLPCKNQSDGIQWKDIKFHCSQGHQISFRDVKHKGVNSVQIKIARSKMDQNGYGRLVKHSSVPGPQCIVKKLVDWVITCRDTYKMSEDDFLFKKNGEAAMINERTVSLAMKAIVKFLGWSSSKVSPHSLRYGGATMLAAAGLPQYIIAYFGGWSNDSKSLRIYTQVGNEAVSTVSRIMSAGHDMSLEESRIRASATSM